MNIDLILAFGGTIVNLMALLVAVSRIQSSSAMQHTATEVRNAERYTELKTKMERVEYDVQALFQLSRKNHET